MTHRKLIAATFFAFLFISQISFGQSPVLGKAAPFAVFTSAGLITNVGATTITGDVGTAAERIDGFGTVTQTTGALYLPIDPFTQEVKTDVDAAYDDLASRTSDFVLGTPIGTVTGQTLTPQVYSVGSAAALSGNLILDAGGNASAIFIIKIDGALSTAAGSEIILAGGALASNVYFQVNGAVELGNNSIFQGTIIAKGAISLLPGASLNGRALSTAGAINLENNIIINLNVTLPVTLISFTAKKSENQSASLNWATTAETNSDRFEIEHSANGKNWKNIATVTARGESKILASYQYSDVKPGNGTNLYRLKMIDKDETFAYSRIRSVEFTKDTRTVLYPNPAVDQLTLDADDMSQIERIQFNNIFGKVVFDQTKTAASNMSSNVDVKNLPTGMYVVKVTRSNGPATFIKILKQ